MNTTIVLALTLVYFRRARAAPPLLPAGTPWSSYIDLKRKLNQSMKTAFARWIVPGVTLALALPALGAEDLTTALDKEAAAKAFPSKPHYSPYAGRNFPGRPLFGDTHLHTAMF